MNYVRGRRMSADSSKRIAFSGATQYFPDAPNCFRSTRADKGYSVVVVVCGEVANEWRRGAGDALPGPGYAARHAVFVTH